MESYEKASADAESQADRLEEESERVDQRIAETKSDLQSKQGMPGIEPDDDAEDAGEARDPAEAAEEGEEPNAGGVD